jgi:acyl-CoA thioester hydrolase
MLDRVTKHESIIRVRYAETDQMGFVHHANYLVYFELGRTELLRASGCDYKSIEEKGAFLVVAKVDVKFRSPAKYDDLLVLETSLARVTPVRIEHKYRVLREGRLLAEGESTLACVDREGRLRALPEEVAGQG